MCTIRHSFSLLNEGCFKQEETMENARTTWKQYLLIGSGSCMTHSSFWPSQLVTKNGAWMLAGSIPEPYLSITLQNSSIIIPIIDNCFVLLYSTLCNV